MKKGNATLFNLPITTKLGITLVSFLLILIFFGEWIMPYDPFQIDMNNRLESMSHQHWLGTDQLGRDIFSRIVYGAKLTIGLGVITIILSVIVGVPIGLISGFSGGKIDAVFMRIIDAILTFPDFILAIAIAGLLGPSLTNIVIAIVLVRWIVYARLVRSQVLELKQQEYILASKISYSSKWRTIRMHILPHLIPTIIAIGAVDVGKVILLISSLSYIGLGAQPHIPEWGAMLNDGRGYFQVVPALMMYPGLAIMLTVLIFHLLGDGLKNRFDIRKRGLRK
ncbi:peptide/nickel transport system permease protein [Natronobacillus azotifigens]|uniref:ABC transporter permease subunit n=1 Tax=Natronobacillus azotifigens TaxID=472978 RepID=A0A9J6RC07_9BACI|nr:nickel transporter permease [Natronobacillus azotifigens]MCZ0703079.1 ABC transporter permease subunit [Natronobacillus azotifigens]